MADMELIFTIPEEKLAIVVEIFPYMHPIPVDNDGNPMFNLKNWFKEYWRRQMRDDIARGVQKKLHDENPYSTDDGIVI